MLKTHRIKHYFIEILLTIRHTLLQLKLFPKYLYVCHTLLVLEFAGNPRPPD